MSSAPADVAAAWLEGFSAAVPRHDVPAISALFLPDGWWRDQLALSWDIRSFHTRAGIEEALREHLADASFTSFVASPDFTPRSREAAGQQRIELIFDYQAVTHRGRGAAVLVAGDDGEWRAFTLLTAMQELAGHEESVTTLEAMRSGQYRNPTPGRRRWFEQREDAFRAWEQDLAVLVIGAGHAGLGLAARLGRLGVPALVVDRVERVGDNWRKRYANLQLHDPTFANHLPYLRFPDPTDWPVMLPKDKLADWLEMYARVMDINVWTLTEVLNGSYDAHAREWTVHVRRDGEELTLRPRHVVLATGLFGLPFVPELDGMSDFAGEIVHSSAFSDGKNYAGRDAVVVGTGASAFDIAQDLYEQGARTTLVQRSSTYVMSTEHGVYTFFERHRGQDRLENIELLGNAIPPPLAIALDQEHTVAAIAELDRELLEGLERAGFRTNRRGALSSSLLTDRGSYYFDQGGCQLVIEGKVAIRRGTVVGFTRDSVVFADGGTLEADLVVLSTGYKNMRESARALFGDAVAERCGDVLGIDEERNELGALWRRSGQPGLWLHAGGLAQCRYYSRIVALQIKASEIGLLG